MNTTGRHSISSASGATFGVCFLKAAQIIHNMTPDQWAAVKTLAPVAAMVAGCFAGCAGVIYAWLRGRAAEFEAMTALAPILAPIAPQSPHPATLPVPPPVVAEQAAMAGLEAPKAP